MGWAMLVKVVFAHYYILLPAAIQCCMLPWLMLPFRAWLLRTFGPLAKMCDKICQHEIIYRNQHRHHW